MTAPTALDALAGRVCDRMTPDLDGVPGIDFLPAMAAETMATSPMMPRRCVGCAFSPGTDANLTDTTRAAAKECVERSHPFWCHKAEDRYGFKTHLCAGWISAIRARARTQETTDVE